MVEVIDKAVITRSWYLLKLGDGYMGVVFLQDGSLAQTS